MRLRGRREEDKSVASEEVKTEGMIGGLTGETSLVEDETNDSVASSTAQPCLQHPDTRI